MSQERKEENKKEGAEYQHRRPARVPNEASTLFLDAVRCKSCVRVLPWQPTENELESNAGCGRWGNEHRRPSSSPPSIDAVGSKLRYITPPSTSNSSPLYSQLLFFP